MQKIIVDGFDYRYAHVPNPPCSGGVGIEDPTGQYWITETHIYFRPHLPVIDGESIEGWRAIGEDHPLHNLRIYLYHIPRLPGGWSCRFLGQDKFPNSFCGLCRGRGGWDECVYSMLPNL